MSAAKPEMSGVSWDNESGSEGATNTARSLTHSSDLTREGLGMKPTRKVCARCMRDLPTSDFSADPRMSSGLKSYCRDCCRADARERRAANPERHREVARAAATRRRTPEATRKAHLKTMYGLAWSDYLAMLDAQNHRCAICGTETPGGKGGWHVDHCHDTGRVRALLCAGCNVGIGQLNHDPARLRAAADYIEKHQEQ